MRDLRAQRELRGLTLRQVAEATGISADILHHLEEAPNAELVQGSNIARKRERYVAYLQQRPAPLEPSEDYDEPTETTTTGTQTLRSPVGLARALGLGVALAVVVLLGLRVASELWDAGADAEHPAAAAEALAPAAHALSVRAIEPTRIRAVTDGEIAHDGLLVAGRSLQLEARRELVLEVPDLTRVRIRYNGQALRPLGNLSAGRRLVFIDDETP
jgi:hypothetical protein